MESNIQQKPVHKKRRYNIEPRLYETESSIIAPKNRSDIAFTPTPKPLLEWESQHEVDQFDDEQG